MIDHGASLYFHHGWQAGVTDPARFAAQLEREAARLSRIVSDLLDRLSRVHPIVPVVIFLPAIVLVIVASR